MFKKKLDRSENKVLELVLNHASLCKKCVKALCNAIHSLKACSIDEFRREVAAVHRSEEEADEIRRKIIEELAKGIVPPLSREDFIRLVERMDMIADWSRDAARLLEIEFIRDAFRNGEFSKMLCEMASNIYYCVELTEEAVKEAMEDFNKSLKFLNKIEEIEEQVDLLYVKSLSVLCSMRMNKPEYSLIAERLVETLENICDAAEDTGDVLKVIIVRALK